MQTKRLLIIEDDYDVAEMLLMYFTSHKYEVFHADNGQDGIHLARSKFPNLILLDVMLPEMNGYEVCADLRNTALTRHIPVIFLTQKDDRTDKVEGLQLGADDYIPKPFDVDELRLRAQRSIERATRESLHEPRTGLPTGPMVEDEFNRAERDQQSYEALYFAIQGFDAFRDSYGFMSADQVMAFAAKTLRESVGEYGTENDFVGILDDTFVVLTYAETPSTLLENVTTRFNQGAKAFYTFVDVEQGGIVMKQGQDGETIIPIMYLEQVAAIPGTG